MHLFERFVIVAGCLRNGSLLAVTFLVIKHFLDVSYKVDQIMSAERE